MRLVITGGSSFVGAHLCRRAAERHDVVALYHSTPVRLPGVTPLRVDLRRGRDLERIRALRPDAVVHAAAKIRAPAAEGGSPSAAAAALNRELMAAVLAIGAPVLYLGSTVVHWPAKTAYAEARRFDEADLAASGLPWAALRPCAPYGPPLVHHRPHHRESFHRMAGLVARLPLVPVPGDGSARRQPIHVDDLAELALRLIEGGLPNEAYDAGGATAHTFDELVQILARKMGRRVRPLHVPAGLLALAARASADFDPELMRAADADDVADPAAVVARTGFRPRGFEAGAAELVAGLRQHG